MSFSRRQFLQRAAGSGLLLGLGGIPLFAKGLGDRGLADRGLADRALVDRAHDGGASAAAAGQALRFSPLFSGSTMTAQTAQVSVWPDAQTEVWSINGVYPSPTIKVQKGATFSVKLVNQLSESTILHWHGLPVPAMMDGHPMSAIDNGQEFDYSFQVGQRAGTYWYHPHPDMRTGKQVYKGIAGFFIVEDPEEQALTLPRGKYDVPLLLQDRRLTFDRSFLYPNGDQDILVGVLGDAMLANGTPDAYLEVDRGLYRFRMLNGSNARILKLAFSDQRTFHLIASDGGLLDKPVAISQLTLAPGERAELLVDFSGDGAGSNVTLKTLQFEDPSGGDQGREMSIIRFDVTSATGAPATIPTTLSQLERLDPTQAVQERTFEFRSDFGSPPMHSINNRMFEMMRIDEQMRPGDIEIWTFMNRSQMPHPIHAHGAQFQVIDVAGETTLAPEYLGWKDTVLANPYEPIRVVVKIAPHLGVFLLHCHNLEHEDHGMMLNFEVTNTIGVEEDRRGMPREMRLW